MDARCAGNIDVILGRIPAFAVGPEYLARIDNYGIICRENTNLCEISKFGILTIVLFIVLTS